MSAAGLAERGLPIAERTPPLAESAVLALLADLCMGSTAVVVLPAKEHRAFIEQLAAAGPGGVVRRGNGDMSYRVRGGGWVRPVAVRTLDDNLRGHTVDVVYCRPEQLGDVRRWVPPFINSCRPWRLVVCHSGC